MNKYTRLFIDESRVYLPAIGAILGRLRAGTPEELDLREGQRLAHSIKGMALYEQQPAIAALSWAMERGFERLGQGAHPAEAVLLAGLTAATPVLEALVDEVERSGTPAADPAAAVLAIEQAL